jgi:very-short-patch-repair endonuclease
MENNLTDKLESRMEEKLYSALCALDIKPELQYQIGYFRVDMAYPDIKLAVEVDGFKYHTGEKNWAKDKYRQKRIEDLGWKFERFQGWLINRYPIACAGKIGLRYMPEKMTERNKEKAKDYLEVMYYKMK